MTVALEPRIVIGFDPLRDKSYRDTALGPDIVAFLAWCELGGMSGKTVGNYEPDLSRGALMFPDKGIGDLTDDDLIHIASRFPIKSRRTRMSAWKSFYKWALRSRRVTYNPCGALPDFRKPTPRVQDTFSDAEVDALLGLPIRDAAPLGLMLEAGPRKAECRNLRVAHCLPESGQVVILNGKGGRDRIVPMSARLTHLMSELLLLEGLQRTDHVFYAVKRNQHEDFHKILRDKPVGEGTFHRWWERCLKQAGVRYRSPHTARHTFATRWRLRGLAIDDLQILLGHASIHTTASVYVHTRAADVAERMRIIEASEV